MDQNKVKILAWRLLQVLASPDATNRMLSQIERWIIQIFLVGVLVGGVLGWVICKLLAG